MSAKTAAQPPLPEAFLQRMQRLLAGEFDDFLSSYDLPAWSGLRANTLKVSLERLQTLLPYALQPVPWCAEGFSLSSGGQETPLPAPGKHPFHAAGLYYLHDPSAMAVVEVLDPQPGERILDLAAAPGGKSTHIAARLQQRGLLVCNEIHPSRIWELAQNLERWGAHNAIVCNETPERLASHFPGFFDRVLVDAPCSGEGLFRKTPASRKEWSLAVVQSCALRQSAILDQAARLVRPGGRLAYSTCTFSPEENEGVIAAFLQRHPGFQLAQIAVAPGLSPGRPEWLSPSAAAHPPGMASKLEARSLARIWPHLSCAEGHFIALLQRMDGTQPSLKTSIFPRSLPGESGKAWQRFAYENLRYELDAGRVAQVGSYLYALPEDTPAFGSLKLIHPGWWLGRLAHSARSGLPRVEPSHALALGLQPAGCQRSLPVDYPQAQRYLQGEMLAVQPGEEGWLLVNFNGYTLGWGKCTSGRVNNHYPRGLRTPAV